MPVYDVEIHVVTREVYSVDADSPEDARNNWVDGTLYVSEAMFVNEIVSVTEDESW